VCVRGRAHYGNAAGGADAQRRVRQSDAGTQVRSDACIDFRLAGAMALSASLNLRAAPAPAGMTLSDAARRRVMERTRWTRARRRQQPG
jgi:hypothetical protein